MIGKKSSLIASSIAAAVMLLGMIIAGIIGAAQATLIAEEEHWKYRVDRWLWDEDRRRTYGIVTPQIVIENETADRLEGYVADANGTRFTMYNDEHVVMVRFMSEMGSSSGWEMAGRVHEGNFAIDIPQQYREAETVRIHIGTHQYTVDNGTPTTPQTEVFINAAMTSYTMNSTLDQIVTEVAQAEEPVLVRSIYDGGSLIDWILNQNGMLSVRSSNSSE